MLPSNRTHEFQSRRTEVDKSDYTAGIVHDIVGFHVVVQHPVSVRMRQGVSARTDDRRHCFRLLESLKTETKVYYYSRRDWVRRLGNNPGFSEKEAYHG